MSLPGMAGRSGRIIWPGALKTQAAPFRPIRGRKGADSSASDQFQLRALWYPGLSPGGAPTSWMVASCGQGAARLTISPPLSSGTDEWHADWDMRARWKIVRALYHGRRHARQSDALAGLEAGQRVPKRPMTR